MILTPTALRQVFSTIYLIQRKWKMPTKQKDDIGQHQNCLQHNVFSILKPYIQLYQRRGDKGTYWLQIQLKINHKVLNDLIVHLET